MGEDHQAAISDFVGSMSTGVSVEHILDRFTSRVVELIPVTGAGVTLIGSEADAGYVTASSPEAMRFERLQSQCNDGPCVAVLKGGEMCAVPDLRADTRFGRYRPAALQAGLGAVFSFPLRIEELTFGAVDIYCETPSSLSPDDVAAAQLWVTSRSVV